MIFRLVSFFVILLILSSCTEPKTVQEVFADLNDTEKKTIGYVGQWQNLPYEFDDILVDDDLEHLEAALHKVLLTDEISTKIYWHNSFNQHYGYFIVAKEGTSLNGDICRHISWQVFDDSVHTGDFTMCLKAVGWQVM